MSEVRLVVQAAVKPSLGEVLCGETCMISRPVRFRGLAL
jgi:hypothetical protein